jgi:RNA recognition motif. (a.k.a. RRM, RBD, or RNP domain)/Zinc finger C-x8-C-x5-C-x3-H type (and similar)
MHQEEVSEDVDNEVDDNKKVYVSRLPYKWTEDQLAKHFEACFGAVKSVEIKWDTKNDCSLGYGFIVFETEVSRNAAVEQGSMHAKKKTIQIRAVEREETALGRGRDTGICYLWQKFSCVKGVNCIFLHDGPGACVQASAYGEGKQKKCMSFKSKGKCSKGDNCPFLHIGKPAPVTLTTVKSAVPDLRVKYCHTFQKTGKCRKGDSCKFSHSIEPDAASTVETNGTKSSTDKKRCRIDGDELVSRKKAVEALM